MSEEEIIDKLTKISNNFSEAFNYNVDEKRKLIQGLLDLYNNEKEINQVHQKLNGELRVKINKLEEENSMLKGMFKKSIN